MRCVVFACLLVFVSGCSNVTKATEQETVTVTAIDLDKQWADDKANVKRRYHGKKITVTGELGQFQGEWIRFLARERKGFTPALNSIRCYIVTPSDLDKIDKGSAMQVTGLVDASGDEFIMKNCRVK